MLRRETPVWANAFACCGGEAEAGFPDPLKAQQTNYNLHKSGILRSSACGEGISFATANELSCLNTNPLHSTSLRSWKCRKHKAFDSCFQPGGPAGRRALCPALREGSHRPGSERARNQDAKVTSGRFPARHMAAQVTWATHPVTATSCLKVSRAFRSGKFLPWLQKCPKLVTRPCPPSLTL